MELTDRSRRKFIKFLSNQVNRGHATRAIHACVDEQFARCRVGARNTAEKVFIDLPYIEPRRILEIGCSTGLNCFALKELYPNAEVIGLECEQEAIDCAAAFSVDQQLERPWFVKGYAEQIPLDDRTVDLIVCHTVIEHVWSVEQAISEMARVLTFEGAIHLEAPNYSFPCEPHLNIFTIPALGKLFIKFSALLQGKWSQCNFINHLQLVNSKSLEAIFEKNSLQWENRAMTKILEVTAGKQVVKKYHFLASILKGLDRFGMASAVIKIIKFTGIYPSLLYTLAKKPKR